MRFGHQDHRGIPVAMAVARAGNREGKPQHADKSKNKTVDPATAVSRIIELAKVLGKRPSGNAQTFILGSSYNLVWDSTS